jgi:DNA-binding transcriptional LysR family regulator
MELTQLAQFKAIAECQSLSRAAEKIYISQPSLSAALQKLEDELGVLLFERRKGRIFLNEAGEIALSHVTIILEQVEKMKLDMNHYKRKENTISIAFCDPGPLRYCIPKFSVEFPDIEIHYSRFEENGNEFDLLFNGINDIIFTSKIIEHNDVTCSHFITDKLLLSVPAPHPLAKEKMISLRNIKSLEIGQPNPGGSFLSKQRPFWEQLKPHIKMTLYDDPAVFNQILRNTNGITMSTRLVRHYRDDGPGRVLIPLAETELSIDYYICFLTENKKWLNSFLIWAEKCISDFEKEQTV